MGRTLHSALEAARMVNVRPATLDTWIKNREFETAQVSEDSNTHEKTFYFTEADLSRLSEFVISRAKALPGDARPQTRTPARRAAR